MNAPTKTIVAPTANLTVETREPKKTDLNIGRLSQDFCDYKARHNCGLVAVANMPHELVDVEAIENIRISDWRFKVLRTSSLGAGTCVVLLPTSTRTNNLLNKGRAHKLFVETNKAVPEDKCERVIRAANEAATPLKFELPVLLAVARATVQRHGIQTLAGIPLNDPRKANEYCLRNNICNGLPPSRVQAVSIIASAYIWLR